VLLVTTIALALSAGGSVASDRKAPPALHVKSTAPVTLTGERFRARERVVVRVTTPDATRSRRIRATRRGTFVTQFPDTFVDRCNTDFRAFAVGNLGSRAHAKVPQLQCPPR
jgi:hypothetical protein